jgi:hypothetical protein
MVGLRECWGELCLGKVYDAKKGAIHVHRKGLLVVYDR